MRWEILRGILVRLAASSEASIGHREHCVVRTSLGTPLGRASHNAALFETNHLNCLNRRLWFVESKWMVQRQIETVSPEEMQKRWDAMSGVCSGAEQAKK